MPTASPYLAPRYFAPRYFGWAGARAAPPAPPPADLGAAIVARFEAFQGSTLAALTAIYATQAGDRAEPPYLVYRVTSGAPYYTSSTSYWHDDRVSFKVYAHAQDRANQLRDLAGEVFGVGAFDYQDGFSIPFFQVNRSEGKEPGRGVKSAFVFRAQIDYSARCQRY